MKRFSIGLVWVMLFFFRSEARSLQANGYVIHGIITDQASGKVYLTHTFQGRPHTDSALLKNGAFLFSGAAPESLFYTIQLTRSDTNRNASYFLLNNTVVSFKAKKDSLAEAVITGLPDNTLYREFYSVAWKPLQDSAGKIYERLDSAEQHGKVKLDSATRQSFDREFAGVDKFNYSIVKSFVEAYPGSAATAAVIVDRFINYPNFEKADTLYGLLKESARNSVFGREIKAAVDLDAKLGVGKPAPDFAQPDTAGVVRSLHDLRGSYVLVDFWASWCGPCRAENPNVVKVYNKFHDKGFTVLGVSLDSKKDPWLHAIQTDGLRWNQVSDLKGWSNEVAALYGIKAVPQNFLLDREGRIVAKGLRGEALEKALEELIH